MTKDTKMQTIYIELMDGRTLTYAGPAQVDPKDEGLGVISVKFGEPKDLPEGSYWGEVEGGDRQC